MRFLAILSLVLCVSSMTAISQQQAAPPPMAPPMGWNSWNHFAGHVTDADVRSTADMLVSTGMRDAGYVYVNIDDTWEGQARCSGDSPHQ